MRWLLKLDDSKSPLVLSHVEDEGQAPMVCHQLCPPAPKTGEQVSVRDVRWRCAPPAEKMVLCVALQAGVHAEGGRQRGMFVIGSQTRLARA